MTRFEEVKLLLSLHNCANVIDLCSPYEKSYGKSIFQRAASSSGIGLRYVDSSPSIIIVEVTNNIVEGKDGSPSMDGLVLGSPSNHKVRMLLKKVLVKQPVYVLVISGLVNQLTFTN